MAESCLSENRHYIKLMNDPLSVNQYTIQVRTSYKLLTTIYEYMFCRKLSHTVYLIMGYFQKSFIVELIEEQYSSLKRILKVNLD